MDAALPALEVMTRTVPGTGVEAHMVGVVVPTERDAEAIELDATLPMRELCIAAIPPLSGGPKRPPPGRIVRSTGVRSFGQEYNPPPRGTRAGRPGPAPPGRASGGRSARQPEPPDQPRTRASPAATHASAAAAEVASV
jgi:hypothetical protein